LPAIAKKLSGRPVKGKPVPAVCRGLVITPIDRQSREVAIEQGAGAAVTDDREVVVVRGLRNDPLNRADDACLGSRCRLPTANTLLRVRKERVGGFLEFLPWQISGRRSIGLAESGDNAIAGEAEPGRENFCAVTRFALAVTIYCPQRGCD